MIRSHAALAILAATALATPAGAQEWQVAREQFAFIGTRLTVQVDVETPGSVRIIRGAPGAVRVAGRAGDGFTTSGLADGRRLTLSAAGPGPVDYLVAVPENVFVEVRLPGRTLAERVGRGQSGQWQWAAHERSEPGRAPELISLFDLSDDALFTTYVRDQPPTEVDLPELDGVARISVRLEGTRFRVAASRPLSLEEGNPLSMVIIPARPPMDLVLTIPAATPAFTLRLGGHTALIVDADLVTTLCAPVTEQWLSNDRHWFTFNPRDGSLECGVSTVRRHGG